MGLVRTLLLVTTVLLPCSVYGQDQDQLRSELLSKWELLRSSVETAKIDYSRFHFKATSTPDPAAPQFPRPTVSPEELLELIGQYDLTNAKERLEFQAAIHAGQEPLLPNMWLEGLQLIVAGDSLLSREKPYTYLVDKEYLFYTDTDAKTKQIHVYRRGQSNLLYTDLHTLFPIPEADRLPADWDIRLEGDEYILTPSTGLRIGDRILDGSVQTYDFETGLPRQITLREKGAVTRMAVHLFPIELEPPVVFPQITVTADFEEEQLSCMDVYHLDWINVNSSLQPDEVHLAAEGGATLFDHSYGTLWAGEVPPVTDVLGYYKENLIPVSPPELPLFTWWHILLLFNGIVLIVAGVFLWRRN